MKAIIETSELKRLIKATAKFISKDDNRQMLQYIKLAFMKDGFNFSARAVGVDGYRLSVENAKCLDIDESFAVFIKPYLPVGARCEHAIVELVDGRRLIDIGGRMVGYKQPDGTFLNETEVIANIEERPVIHEVFVSKNFLYDALNSIQADELLREPVSIQLRDRIGAITLKTKNGARYVLPVRNP